MPNCTRRNNVTCSRGYGDCFVPSFQTPCPFLSLCKYYTNPVPSAPCVKRRLSLHLQTDSPRPQCREPYRHVQDASPRRRPSASLHTATEHAAAATLPALRLSLHLLADLDIDFEELGDAAIEADGFALVEVGLAVRAIDALLAARSHQTVRIIISHYPQVIEIRLSVHDVP